MNGEASVKKHCCPPHHWFVPWKETNGVVLARCMRPGCTARQFQALWISNEAVEEANKLNRRNHYPRIKLDRKAVLKIMRFLNAPTRRYDRKDFLFV